MVIKESETKAVFLSYISRISLMNADYQRVSEISRGGNNIKYKCE